MNENIDLTKILKDCPQGTVFWSDNYGEVQFLSVSSGLVYPIQVRRTDRSPEYYTKEGWCNLCFPANCLLWPSKDCRDWSKFTAPWYKKDKFDHKTLKPFDKVLVRDKGEVWDCDFFSYISNRGIHHPYVTLASCYDFCIPYNDDTKHLVGTTDEAPEYYRYWEE